MNQTVATWNTWSNYQYSIGVIYSSGTPTADAGYLGQIRFGGSRNYRVAMHESSHWLGTGTVGPWEGFFRFGRWTGTYAYNLHAAYAGPGERMSGDRWHYWPYGANFDSEGVDGPKMVGIIGAFRRDMNLAQGDRTIGIAPGIYRLRHRQTLKMLDSMGATAGGTVKQNENAVGPSQQWTIARVSGTPHFTLQNVETGLHLDSLAEAVDGAEVTLSPLGSGGPLDSQLWEILATDSFFFKIVSKANGKALDTLGLTPDGSAVGQWSSGSSWNQHWTFVHPLVQFAPEAGVVSQGRPSAASSSEGGNQHWKGNNGVSGDRWTASSGSYPQWWQVDLGSVQPVTKVETDWFAAGGRSYRYRIEVSDDGATFALAADRTQNTASGTTVDLLNVTGRYVRITISGSTTGWAAIHECRVYNEVQPMRLLSQHRPATASSQQAGNLAVNATDVDSLLTRWAPNSGNFPQWWQVDLGSNQPVNKVVIQWFGDGERSYQYRIDGSTEGTRFNTLVDRTQNTTLGATTDLLSGSARYVRVTVTGSSQGWAGFYDVQIYGSTTALPPAAPTSFTADPVGSAIELSWSDVMSATAYRVKRSIAGFESQTVVATLDRTSFSDTDVVPGVPYHYTITASNGSGESPPSAVASAALDGELHLHLPFDENSGALAPDASGFRRGGTLFNGATWKEGQIGYAVSLHGEDAYVAIPAGVVSALNNFTIAMWVHPDSIRTGARIFDFGNDTDHSMFLALANSGSIQFAIRTPAVPEQQLAATSVLPAGTWSHIAITLSGTAGRLYVNGQTVAANRSMSLRPSSLGITQQNWIGRSQGPDPYFEGMIDDFRIYNRALTAPEIHVLRGLSAPSTPKLIARAGHASADLAWTSALGATNYHVKRSVSSGGPYTHIATVSSAFFPDTGLTNGTTYHYVVAAVNASGQSADSPEAIATPRNPADPLTPSETWRRAHFGSPDPSAEAADQADPDGDGIPNLLEYALGSKPLVANDGTHPVVSSEGGKLSIRFQRNTAATDLILSVVAANALAGNWAEIARSTGGEPFVPIADEAVIHEENTSEVRPVQVTDIQLVTDPTHPKRFMRLNVSRIAGAAGP